MDRTYPREWFEVSQFSASPHAKTFTRETDRLLFYSHNGRERRESKSTRYSAWYPTKDEAEAVIAYRKQRESEKQDAREYAELAVRHCRAAGLTLDDLRSAEPRNPA